MGIGGNQTTLENKLRIKTIATAMAAVLIVIGVMVLGISLFGYHETIATADHILDVIVEHDGEIPPESVNKSEMPAETPYSQRFFTVSVTRDGAVVELDSSHIMTVDVERAVRYALMVARDMPNDGRGFVGSYRFDISTDGDVRTVAFLDCDQMLRLVDDFVRGTVAVAMIGTVCVFILVVLFSRRMIGPTVEAYRKQRQFITDAGHELKTPLTVIKADAELLAMDLSEPNEWLDDINEQVDKMTSLTNDLVFLAKTDELTGTMKTEVDLSRVVRDAVDDFKSVARTHGAEISDEIDDGIVVSGEEKSLSSLVGILVDNALKYADTSEPIRVVLKRHRMMQCSLMVSNKSVTPIKKKALTKMFDRFYRNDESHNKETGGFGIGLSIAQAVVASHGGKISAMTDKSGEYLTIRASIPTALQLFSKGNGKDGKDGEQDGNE